MPHRPPGQADLANRALLKNLGKSLESCLGKSLPQLYPGGVADKLVDDELEVLSSGHTLDVIYEYRPADGGPPRFVESVRHPVYDAERAIVGVQSIFWDVTDRKLAEEDLKCTKAQLETVLQSVPSGIFAVDQDCRFTIVNQQAEKLMDFDAAEALGQPASKFIPDTKLHRVLKTGKLEMGKPFTHNQRTFLVSRSPIMEQGNIIGAVSVFQDESELEAVQRQLEELRRLNDELSSLIENSHDGILITDTDQVLTVNPSFGRITGLAPLPWRAATSAGWIPSATYAWP